MTYEELLAAGAEPADEPKKGKGLTYEQLLAAGAEPVPGHDPRAAARGMRPEPKPDEVDAILGDYGKHDVNRMLQGRKDLITTPEDRVRLDDRRQREDPIKNDPLAGMIMQGIPAAGAGAAVAGLTGVPILGNAVQGAMMDPDHPIRGAALNMVPGVPGAVRQADNAIGSTALSRVNAGSSLVPAAKAAGTAAGTIAGHSVVPYVGAPIGAALGSKLGGAAGRGADSIVGAIGRRHLLKTAAAAPPIAPDVLADILAQTEPRAPLPPLAPQPGPAPAMPTGAFGAPMFDEFGMPLTKGGPVNHPTVGGATNPGGLRADVVRDAAAFRAAPPEAQPGVESVLGDQLAKSVRLLDELRAGKITAQQAIDAGLPSGIVAKALH